MKKRGVDDIRKTSFDTLTVGFIIGIIVGFIVRFNVGLL
jgi:hypothetical protein